jgi:hypothetical protein
VYALEALAPDLHENKFRASINVKALFSSLLAACPAPATLSSLTMADLFLRFMAFVLISKVSREVGNWLSFSVKWELISLNAEKSEEHKKKEVLFEPLFLPLSIL